MNKTSQFIALGSYLALASSGVLLGAGCAAETHEQVADEEATIKIRFHEGAEKQLQSMLAPIEYTDVNEILVDVIYTSNEQPFIVNFGLTQFSENEWEGTLPFLPSNEELRFEARAYDVDDTLIFSGETLATLTIANESVQIPLAPVQNEETFDMPRMFRIAYPDQVVAGQEVQIIFTVEGNAGETIGYSITSDDGSTPFSPSAGTVTFGNTVADFITLYTAPEVTAETTFNHVVTITSEDSLSSVAIDTNFSTTVVPRPDGVDGVPDARPSVLFNPVVLSLTANGTETPGTVALDAEISDDGDPTLLSYQWDFTPNTDTPTATFANSGTGNPGLMEGYTVDHQGTITLQVTDENNGTTTLYYDLVPNQFADAIDHVAVGGLKSIVAGDEHTCALTGEGKVRCWGEAQNGQLGYGNAQDIGDDPARLPYTAGDVDLLAGNTVTHLVAGDHHTCALLESGFVYCWGRNNAGQLGYGDTDDVGDGEPVTSAGYVSLGGLATKIAAGGNHTCAILQSGALRCWGANGYGQLGHGHTNNIGDDENVFDAGNVNLGEGVEVTDIAVGDWHTCALLSTGNIRCWGRNNWGQLGYGHANHIGDDEGVDTLADVSLPGPVRKVVASHAHTCALLENGALRCWGHGRDGRTGYGFRSSSNPNYGDNSGETPLNLSDISVGAVVTDVTIGDYHTCALLSDGQLKCWGANGSGQLGYGDTSNRGTPAGGVDLDGASAYQLAAGLGHTCALRSNGTARCWGNGGSGRLGQGATSNILSPAATGDIAILEAP